MVFETDLAFDMGMFLRSHFFIIIEKKITQKPFTNYVCGNSTLV